MRVSAWLRGGPMTRSCCSRGSRASLRESGSPRRCSLCGAAPLRRSPWQRRACSAPPMAASRSASVRAARRSWRACTVSRGSNRSAACATRSSQSGRCSMGLACRSTGSTSGHSGLGLHRNGASRSSLRRSPRPRSALQVSSRTTGCRSSGHARDSTTAGRCWPRARQPASARPRPASPRAFRSRSLRTTRPPGRSPPVGCSPI